MKRLDKPTKHELDNLLNIEKKPLVPVKLLATNGLSGYLIANTLFCYLQGSGINIANRLQFTFTLNPKRNQRSTVKDI
jgi:hypothetical protein